MKSTAKQITIGGMKIPVTRKNIKNIYVRITDEGAKISAPLRASDAVILAFAQSRMDWIKKHIDKGSPVPAETPQPEQVERLKHDAAQLIEYWSEIMGVNPKEWRLRSMKTRWGSCNPVAGRIWLNTRLAYKPRGCLEYIVVHELAHLIERSHGPAFKAIMDNFLPDWRMRRKELNTNNGRKL